MHGIPGVFGGLVSAIIIAFYNEGYNSTNAAAGGPSGLFAKIVGTSSTFGRSTSVDGAFLHQAWLQVAGTFISVALAIVFGLIAGYVISTFYNERKEQFFKDEEYFDQALFVTEGEQEIK